MSESGPVRDQFSLAGRVALVTGASRGLGFAIAEALGEAGAHVVISARRAEALRDAEERLTAARIAVTARVGDVTDPARAQSMVRETIEREGHLDVLVNNAGTSWGAPFETMPLDRWRQVIETNVTGAFLVTQAAVPHMAARGYGKIIMLASVMGLVGVSPEIVDASGYTASKGALVALTRDLAVKYAPAGVRVNAIAPGFFPTKMSRAVLDRAGKAIRAATPLGRPGRPEEIKGVAVFLASPASDYVTGQVIAVDGGFTAR